MYKTCHQGKLGIVRNRWDILSQDNMGFFCTYIVLFMLKRPAFNCDPSLI